MADRDIIEAPALNLPDVPPIRVIPDKKWQRERIAFYRMLPELLKTHRGRFVAVHDEQVVGSGDNVIDVAKRAHAQYGYVPIYVGFVSERPRPISRVSSPRNILPSGIHDRGAEE
jgi:hypothetical protein